MMHFDLKEIKKVKYMGYHIWLDMAGGYREGACGDCLVSFPMVAPFMVGNMGRGQTKQ